jgi:hypothetical protein
MDGLGWWEVRNGLPVVSTGCPGAMESKAAGFLSEGENQRACLGRAKQGGGGGVLQKFSEKNCLRDLRPAA